MATKNLGNVVGLIKSPTPPAKTFVLWAKQLNPVLNPDLVELHYYNGTAWVPLTGGSSESMINTTYDELRTLRDTNILIPGQQYRITDYITTVREDLEWAISAQHQFDVIVIADSVNTLNAKARAVRTEGDSYFPEYTRFEVWELMYSIDNNVNLYDWADPENGKGVIYYMKDEFNNELSYDFKSIKFKRYKIVACQFPSLIGSYKYHLTVGMYGIICDSEDYKYCYTFHDEGASIDQEVSVNSLRDDYPKHCYNNVIKENIYSSYIDDVVYNRSVLNNNVFIGNACHISGNIFGNDVQNNTFGHVVRDNIIKRDLRECIFDNINGCEFGIQLALLLFLGYISTCKLGSIISEIAIINPSSYIEIKDRVWGGLDVTNEINTNFSFIPQTVTVFRAQTLVVFEAYKDANTVERFNA